MYGTIVPMIVLTADLVPFILQGVFFLLLFVYVIYSSFLAYHWYAYGTSSATTTGVLALYLSVSAVCLLTMATALF